MLPMDDFLFEVSITLDNGLVCNAHWHSRNGYKIFAQNVLSCSIFSTPMYAAVAAVENCQRRDSDDAAAASTKVP